MSHQPKSVEIINASISERFRLFVSEDARQLAVWQVRKDTDAQFTTYPLRVARVNRAKLLIPVHTKKYHHDRTTLCAK